MVDIHLVRFIIDNAQRNFFLNKMCVWSKQWPLAPNSPKWRITRANVSNASHIFPEMTFGECERVSNVSSPGKRVGECRSNVSSPGRRVGECRANVSSPTKTGWQLSAQVR